MFPVIVDEIKIDDKLSGFEYEVKFEVKNISSKDIVILGSSPICNEIGCISFSPEIWDSLIVPRGGMLQIVGKYKVNNPGAFYLALPVYFDIDGVVEIDFTISGNAK